MAQRCVVHQLLAPAVRHVEDTAAVAALDLPVGFHGQAQPASCFALGREDTHTPNGPNITAIDA